MTIKVRYSSIDRFRQTRAFKTLKGARAYAVNYVGDNPDMGSHYAVSFDGIGKIEVSGCTLQELFYDKVEEAGARLFEVWVDIINEDRGTVHAVKDSAHDNLWHANQQAEELERYCDGVRIIGTTDEAKAAIAAQHAAYEAQLFMDREMERNPF